VTGIHALALLAGVLAALGLHAQGLAGAAWPAAAGLALLFAPRLRPLATLCAGLLWAGWTLQHYQHARLADGFDERVLVVAELEDLPLRRGADEFFTAALRPVRAGDLPVAPVRAQPQWRAAPPLHAGERWQLLASLHAPAAAVNPGSLAAAAQPLRLRLHAAGQVLPSALNQRLAPAPASLDALRERLARAIAARVVERDAAALIIALAIGDTQRVSVEQWRVLNAVGITHLVAISGLHVTMFCLLMAGLTAGLWRQCPWLQPRVPRHTCATLVGVAAALGYALLAGWSVPTQRTLLMLASWHGLRIAARPRPAVRTLAAGLIGVLLLDPLAPLAAGFWLSLLAVGALLLQGALTVARETGWRALLRTQAYVTVALLPRTVAVFGSVSLAGLAMNLVAIPVFSLLLVPMILAGTAALGAWPALATLLFKSAAAVIGAFWPMARLVAASPLTLLHVAPPIWWYALAALAGAVALLPLRPWMRCTALLALLPAAVPAASQVPPGTFAATVFDVGRGEAVLLRTAGHALLYDDGEVWGSAGAVAATRLVPGLRHYGLRTLDLVMLPRLDADRGAGVLALSATLPVLQLAAGAAPALPPEFASCVSGAHWQWEGVDFEILDGPSCALRVSTMGNGLLLAPTADAAVQAQRLVPLLQPTAVVLVPGHGSASARQAALMRAAAARIALLSDTARGAQRASAAVTLHAWRAAGAQTHVTGIDGALELRFEPAGTIDLLRWNRP
jgi:competence protein ComEC